MAYELLETIEVGAGGASSIEFSAIPQDGSELAVEISMRESATTTIASLYVTLNNDTGASQYSITRLESNLGTVGSSTTTSNKFFAGYIPGNSITSSTYGSGRLRISNYTSSANKTISLEVATEDNGSSVNTQIAHGTWSGTSGVTSIQLTSSSTSFAQYSTASLYKITADDASGATPSANSPKATGGTISFNNGYFYHKFESSGTFTPSENLTVDYLIVAGGGGGGSGEGSNNIAGGGGGGGGVITTISGLTNVPAQSQESLLASANYSITVGTGGAGGGATGQSDPGDQGLNSVAFSKTAIGGGGGGSAQDTNGTTGGSGGGGAGSGSVSVSGSSGTTDQGTSGGNGRYYDGGGGGGAATAGGNATSTTSGAGGDGVNVNVPISPTLDYVGAGAAGGRDRVSSHSTGSNGLGYGNYGSGGQGGQRNSGGGGPGQDGFDGAVIIWYAA